MSGHRSPLLGSGNRCSYLALGALLVATLRNSTCAVGPESQAGGSSRGKFRKGEGNDHLFNQGSSNYRSGSLSTSTQSLTLGRGKRFKFQAFLAESLFILFFSFCRRRVWAPPCSVSPKAHGLACFTYTGIYSSNKMNRG